MTYTVQIRYKSVVNNIGTNATNNVRTYTDEFLNCPEMAEELSGGSVLIHTEKGQIIYNKKHWVWVSSVEE